MSDTRTNAGVDNISTFKKIFTFNYKEKVYITILASGNLATTQFLVNSLNDIFREKNLETDLIIARAFKPLPVILDLAEKNFKSFKSIIIFLGKNKKDILKKALANWTFEYKEKKSITSSESKIIKICNLKKNEK